MTALVEAVGLTKHYAVRHGWRRHGALRAVDGIDLTVPEGAAVGLVGESGCGKSTVARLLLRLVEPTAGTVRFAGRDITGLDELGLRPLRREMQLIFQNPHAALNPRRTLFASIAEPLVIQAGLGGAALRARVEHLMDDVGLPAQFLWRYPHELSGGQKQRVCIARALALEPRLVILDEPTSALDVSVQAQILAFLAELRARRGLTYLLISHNLAVVRQVCDEVAVMYLGRIVEHGPVAEVFAAPRHPYTRALLAAVLPPRAGALPTVALAGDPPSALELSRGCRFAPRCPLAEPVCRPTDPALDPVSHDHRVACLLARRAPASPSTA
ncbi:MAG: ATP-binding cassette domain-containing protein [Proteobacteria bacterium]|nr:ATP-binding cassette domain-containing protein [Pseudomonadota bacterium]